MLEGQKPKHILSKHVLQMLYADTFPTNKSTKQLMNVLDSAGDM